MDQISIEICTGTACFVMGGADLLLLCEELPRLWESYNISEEDITKVLNIRGKTCTGHCRLPGMRPPFVVVDGVLIAEATMNMIAEAILPQVMRYLEEMPKEEQSC